MKQNITLEQVNELNEDQKHQLTNWFRDEGPWDIVELTNEDKIPLLNIGQMIEFLGNPEIRQVEMEEDESGTIVKWIVELPSNWNSSVELCDALWSAIKRVLTYEEG